MPEVRWQIELGESEQIAEIQEIEVRAGELFRDIGMDHIADADPPSADQLQHHIDSQTLWVARFDDGSDRIAGYLIASVVDGEGHIDQVSVHPAAGGRGLGSALVETSCLWAQNNALESMTLTTFADVPWNGPFYSGRGFVEIDPTSLGPELAEIRAAEIEQGLDSSPRIAMRRHL